MNVVLINGSPRKKGSNTKWVMDLFLKGYMSKTDQKPEVIYLGQLKKLEQNFNIFLDADYVLIFLPLYTDCMPGIIKNFIEMWPKNDGSFEKHIGFFIQSGFPEANHAQWLKRYFTKLITRLGYNYTGTVVRGGIEGAPFMPEIFTKKLKKRIENLGAHYATKKEYEPKIAARLGKHIKYNRFRRFLLFILIKTKLINFMWDLKLKKNGVFEKRFDKPYEN